MSGLSLHLRCTGANGFTLSVDARLPERGITAIYGPSGSGKTTLLTCIAGLRRAGDGTLIHCGDQLWEGPGRFVPPWQRGIGFVFQDARLFPHLDAGQNLDYGQRRQRRAGMVSRRQVVEWLELSPLLQQSPAALSAGQRQRIAIGRALLSSPRLLLLDEPLANLDHAARGQCLRYLQTLHRELGLPMLYVSHDIEEVSQLADHLLMLEAGTVADQGPLLDLCSRLDTRLALEERAAAIVVGKIRAQDHAFGLTELAVDGQTVYVNKLPGDIGQQRRLRIPARDISVCRERPRASSILNILSVRLSEIRASGDAQLLLRLTLGEQHLLARITRKSATELGLAAGDALFAQIKSAALLSEAADP
jgi:molybdate transport system ATP-binding protein